MLKRHLSKVKLESLIQIFFCQVHKNAAQAKKVRGLKAKLLNKKRHSEKVQMKKTIKAHQEKKTKGTIYLIRRHWLTSSDY